MREEKLAKKPELLLPAKDLEVLKTAVRYGADAVYIGGEAYGLRAKARNFSRDEMAEGIQYAHDHGVKVFVTANILAHNSDLAGAEQYFGQLAELGPDAILVADPGMFMLARKACRACSCWRARPAPISQSTFPPRLTTPTTAPLISGSKWEPSA